MIQYVKVDLFNRDEIKYRTHSKYSSSSNNKIISFTRVHRLINYDCLKMGPNLYALLRFEHLLPIPYQFFNPTVRR